MLIRDRQIGLQISSSEKRKKEKPIDLKQVPTIKVHKKMTIHFLSLPDFTFLKVLPIPSLPILPFYYSFGLFYFYFLEEEKATEKTPTNLPYPRRQHRPHDPPMTQRIPHLKRIQGPRLPLRNSATGSFPSTSGTGSGNSTSSSFLGTR